MDGLNAGGPSINQRSGFVTISVPISVQLGMLLKSTRLSYGLCTATLRSNLLCCSLIENGNAVFRLNILMDPQNQRFASLQHPPTSSINLNI